jgi:hypothetical protein
MLWYKVAKKYFLDEVDKVYIQLDFKQHPENAFNLSDKYIKDYFSKDKKIVIGTNKVNGIVSSLDNLLLMVKEDYILFAQEDSFIFKQNILNAYFGFLERNIYDVIGTPMLCYTPQASTFFTSIFGDEPWSLLTRGFAFWPNFFFCKRSDLEKTSLNFNIAEWKKDQYIPFIKTKVPFDIDMDVFAHISLELRALKLRFHYVEQNTDNWAHVTSLSSMFNFFVAPWPNPCQMDNSLRLEIERRYCWWSFAYRQKYSQNSVPKGISGMYGKVIRYLPQVYNFDKHRVRKGINKIKHTLNI